MYLKIVNDVDMGHLQQALTALTDWPTHGGEKYGLTNVVY